jgi:hypothetical protein
MKFPNERIHRPNKLAVYLSPYRLFWCGAKHVFRIKVILVFRFLVKQLSTIFLSTDNCCYVM